MKIEKISASEAKYLAETGAENYLAIKKKQLIEEIIMTSWEKIRLAAIDGYYSINVPIGNLHPQELLDAMQAEFDSYGYKIMLNTLYTQVPYISISWK